MRARITICLVAGLAAVAVFGAEGDDRPFSKTERIAKGRDLVDSICFWCHEPELMHAKHLDEKQWTDLIRPMIYEGAPVTDEEFGWIVEYLTATFGPVDTNPPEEEQ